MSRATNGHGGKREGAGRKRTVHPWSISQTCDQVHADLHYKVLKPRVVAALHKAADDIARGVDMAEALRDLNKTLTVEVPRIQVLREAAKRLKVSVSTVRRHWQT